MSSLAPDPKGHEVTQQLEGTIIRLTCTGQDCGWQFGATDEVFVPALIERHLRATDTYRGK